MAHNSSTNSPSLSTHPLGKWKEIRGSGESQATFLPDITTKYIVHYAPQWLAHANLELRSTQHPVSSKELVYFHPSDQLSHLPFFLLLPGNSEINIRLIFQYYLTF